MEIQRNVLIEMLTAFVVFNADYPLPLRVWQFKSY